MRYIKVCPSTGYWQVELELHNKERQNSHFLKGRFKFNVTPFCFTNAPAIFKHFDGMHLGRAGWWPVPKNLDNVIICSSTFFNNQLRHCASVFDILRTTGLKFKLTYVFHIGARCVSWSHFLQQRNQAR